MLQPINLQAVVLLWTPHGRNPENKSSLWLMGVKVTGKTLWDLWCHPLISNAIQTETVHQPGVWKNSTVSDFQRTDYCKHRQQPSILLKDTLGPVMQYPQYLPDGLGGHSSSGYKGKCGNKSKIKKPETMTVRDFTLMGVRRLYCSSDFF